MEEGEGRACYPYRTLLDDPRIEEYVLDYPMDAIAQGLYPYYVRMNMAGAVDRVEMDLKAQEPSFYQSPPTARRRFIAMTMLARNEAHAVKIANERRALLIANGELKP